jgi:3-oxoacyl-[acyl-carrier-protein] synthase-3
MARTSPQEIDQIILATCSPESTLPAVACRVQQQIGATRAWAMDINAACTGFVYGMVTAGQFLQNGQAGAALVIGSEVMHTRLDWKDRSSCILFGDAAGAVVLERVALGSSARILESFLMSDGRCVEMLHMPPCVLNPGSSFEQEKSLLGNIEMNGREIFKLAVRTMTDSAQYIMAKQGISPSEVDWFIPHQANLRILETVAQRLGLPMEKVLINVQRYGNTSAATIPTVLDEAVRDGRIQKGQLLLMDAFGAGGTYGAILLRW